MTDIDTQADIELHPGDGHVTVSVPLTGAVTGEWLRCYQQLALATKLPAAVQARQDRAWMEGVDRGSAGRQIRQQAVVSTEVSIRQTYVAYIRH